MASNIGSAKPAEVTTNDGISPVADGRQWGITSKSTPGTMGSGSTANSKAASFQC